VRVSGAEGRFTLKLDARQSSSRWQPPALNVDRPTAAFEASELSLSTLTRHRRFYDRLTGVSCKLPFAEFVVKIRIRENQTFADFYRRVDKILRCASCHAEHLLAFSSKRRGFCPSCGARRMAETAACSALATAPLCKTR